MISLLLSEIKDIYIRENFQRLLDYINTKTLNMKKFEATLSGASSNHVIVHNLGYRPKDIIITSKIGPGDVKILYEKTTEKEIYLETTDTVTIRILVGLL